MVAPQINPNGMWEVGQALHSVSFVGVDEGASGHGNFVCAIKHSGTEFQAFTQLRACDTCEIVDGVEVELIACQLWQ